MKTINIGNITKIVLNIDDRIPSEKELDMKYGPGKWAIEFEHEHSSTNSSRRMVNPENPRRRLW
jgi:hypothetical protein